MRTLFLNPPSFEGFDGGASSRWPASREIESYWYPVWLCYPAGMLPDSKVVDAPPHKISIEQTVEMAQDFELLVLFTSTPGFEVDCRIAEMMKAVQSEAESLLRRAAGHGRAGENAERERAPSISSFAANSIIRSSITPTASRSKRFPGASFRKNGVIVNNPEAPIHRKSRCAAVGDEDLQARSRYHAITTFRFC